MLCNALSVCETKGVHEAHYRYLGSYYSRGKVYWKAKSPGAIGFFTKQYDLKDGNMGLGSEIKNFRTREKTYHSSWSLPNLETADYFIDVVED